MGKIRKTKRFSLFACVVAVASVACSGARGPVVTAAPEASSSSPRHPDGVVIDPPGAMPSAMLRADARGVIALREPLGEDAVRVAVTDLARALVREDSVSLEPMFTNDAIYVNGARRLARAQLIEDWKRRFQSSEFQRLAGAEVVRADRIQRFQYDELGGPDEPARPAEMRAGDVLVRVPVETPRAGADRLFGDVWILVLRADGSKYKIALFSELDAG